MGLKEILGEELYNQVTAKLGDNKIAIISDGTWIPKTKFDEINEQKNTYKTQIDTLNGQIKDLEKAAKGNDDLLKQIDTMKKDNEGLNGRIKDITLTNAIKLAAIKAKAKDPADILAFIDKGKLELNEDGTIKGLDDQLKTLSESKAYLFGETTPPETPGANPPGGGNPPKIDYRTASKEDYQKEMSKYGIRPLY